MEDKVEEYENLEVGMRFIHNQAEGEGWGCKYCYGYNHSMHGEYVITDVLRGYSGVAKYNAKPVDISRANEILKTMGRRGFLYSPYDFANGLVSLIDSKADKVLEEIMLTITTTIRKAG